MRKCFYIVFVMGLVLLTSTQISAQHQILDSFTAVQSGNKVIIKLVISGGRSCNGINIYRGTDTTRLEKIGTIAGVCGGSESALAYTFDDLTPVPNTLIYYAAELGNQGFTTPLPFTFLNFDNGVFAYPNPASNYLVLNIDLPENHVANITMYNSVGKQQLTWTSTSRQTTIPVQHLTPGLYYTLINHEGKSSVVPIVIQHIK